MTSADYAKAATITWDAWVTKVRNRKYTLDQLHATNWYKAGAALEKEVHAAPPPPPPPVAGVFVSPTGSDATGDGSILKPFRTEQRAQQAMAAGSPPVCYRRGGADTLTTIIRPRDGQTFQAFDGEPASLNCNGYKYGFLIDGVSDVVLDSYDLFNFGLAAVGVHGGEHFYTPFPDNTGIAARNTIRSVKAHDGSTDTTYPTYWRCPIFTRGNTPRLTIDHPTVHDCPSGGINVATGNVGYPGGNLTDLLIDHPVAYNLCSQDTDQGGVYVQDEKATSTNMRIPGANVRDVGQGRAIYLDDGTSNTDVSDAQISGKFGIAYTIHGGHNNHIHGGRVDATASPTATILRAQTSPVTSDHSGNEMDHLAIAGQNPPRYWLDFPVNIHDITVAA